MYGVTITEIINKLHLDNMTPEIDTDKIVDPIRMSTVRLFS